MSPYCRLHLSGRTERSPCLSVFRSVCPLHMIAASIPNGDPAHPAPVMLVNFAIASYVVGFFFDFFFVIPYPLYPFTGVHIVKLCSRFHFCLLLVLLFFAWNVGKATAEAMEAMSHRSLSSCCCSTSPFYHYHHLLFVLCLKCYTLLFVQHIRMHFDDLVVLSALFGRQTPVFCAC